MKLDYFFRIFCHLFLLRPLVNILFGVNTDGNEHISKRKQFIIIANHNSHLDILLLFHIIPLSQITRTRVVAAGDYFNRKHLLNKVVSFLFDPIWVHRNKQCLSPVKEMVYHLENNGSLLLFPEGTRGTSSEIMKFKKGIGLLCQKFPEVPVIPVYLEGPERSLPKNSFVPLPHLNLITISEPLKYSGDKTESTEALFTRITDLKNVQGRFRHRHGNRKCKPIYVAVIGIDGCGKSSLARALTTDFAGKCCFIGDRLEFYNGGVRQTVRPYLTETVRRWISKKAKLAQNLSSYKYPKILELFLRDRLLKVIERRDPPGVYFLDGSSILNLLAWINIYSKEELGTEKISEAIALLEGKEQTSLSNYLVKRFPELLVVSALGLNRLQLPDEVVFLDPDPDVCLKRI